MKKALIFVILLLCFASLGWAESQSLGVFKQGNCINLLQVCSNCTSNFITSVRYPNSSIAEFNLTMTRTNTEYSRTYCNTSSIGQYLVYGYGDLDGVNTTWGYTFDITPDGYMVNDNPSMSITLFGGIFAAIFILGGILVFSLRRNKE